MSLLNLLSDASVWEQFYTYKQSLSHPKKFSKDLRVFIDEKKYLPVVNCIKNRTSFPLPKRSVISKFGSDKKCIVYTYPDDANTVLKLLTWLIIREYDSIFHLHCILSVLVKQLLQK